MIRAEDYQRVDPIFQAALDMAPVQRAAYLREACNGDETLLKDVEYLLASAENGSEIFQVPVFELVAPLLAGENAELSAGESVGHYHIVSLLGVGGMGQVYLAEDTRLGRKVALKLLPKSYTQNESRLRRFQQEARAASALNHPNILTIYDILEIDGRQFIVTEYVEGESLRQGIKRTKLGVDESIEITIQIASALSAAHRAGIIHRDIKPENIMVRPDGLIKVLDFGLAKLTEGDDKPFSPDTSIRVGLSSGLIMGTPKYMSPEQAQGLQVDQCTDIFSVGVVLYESVTGQTPFTGESAQELIQSVLSDEPAPLKDFNSEVPAELQRIVSTCLSKEKAARYQTTEELLVALTALQKSQQSAVALVLGRVKQHKFIATAGLIAFIAMGFGVFKFATSRSASLPFQQIKVTKLTNFGGAWNPAISPDGKYIAYARRSQDHGSNLLLRALDGSSEKELLALTQDDLGLTKFSQDGSYLYVDINKNREGTQQAVLTIPTLGGANSQLLRKPGSAVSLAPDGRRLAYVYGNIDEGKSTIVVAKSDGSEERQVITRQAPNYYWAAERPAWSPDGKLLACVGQNGNESFPRVFVVDIEAATETPITRQKWNGSRGVEWLPDQSGLLFVAAEETSGLLQIWHISYPSGEVRRITNDTTNYFGIGLSSDGKSLVTTLNEILTAVWVIPVTETSAGGGRERFSLEVERANQINTVNFGDIASSAAGAERWATLAWTPDGKILYSSEETGNSDIWSMNSDGTDRRQLTTDPHIDTGVAVSPDGRTVAFMSTRNGTESIWLMDINGTNQRQFTHKLVERRPSFSADGKWVHFLSWESGQVTVWKAPIDGGPHQPALYRRDSSLISPDGRLRAYAENSRIIIVPVEGGAQITSFDLLGLDYRWSPDGRGLSFVRETNNVANLWEQPLDGSAPRQLTNFSSDGIRHYAWSRDGKKLAVTRGRRISDVVLITEAN